MSAIYLIVVYVIVGVGASIFLTSSLPFRGRQRVESSLATAVLWPIYALVILAAIALRVPARRLARRYGNVKRFHQGRPYGLYNRLDFGKHEGEYVQDIITKDPSYLDYCLENIPGFKLTEEVEKAYEEAD